MELREEEHPPPLRVPDLDVGWARSVLDFTATTRRELLAEAGRGQVEEALLADGALDWALLAWALGAPVEEVVVALTEAGRALVRVRELRGTVRSPSVVVIDDDGVEELEPRPDESLDSDERARLAFHLAGLTRDPALLAAARWPGGTAIEDAALVATAQRDASGVVEALGQVLDRHDARALDPRALVSLPALGIAQRALDAGVVSASDLPASRWLPESLLAAE
jgi:hypothetical protein